MLDVVPYSTHLKPDTVNQSLPPPTDPLPSFTFDTFPKTEPTFLQFEFRVMVDFGDVENIINHLTERERES